MDKSGGKVSGNNLLAKMLMLQDDESGRRLSDQMIEAQVHTFMVAGHETTRAALTWTFYLLAKHQDVQEKVCELSTFHTFVQVRAEEAYISY